MLINEIEQLRKRIDSIDNDILKLISQRRDCAVKIGALKDELRNSSAEGKLGAYDSKRESEILKKLASESAELPESGVEAVYREIISLCRNSAHKTTVCLLNGSENLLNTAIKHFGRSSEFVICATDDELLDNLNKSIFNIAFVAETASKGLIENIEKLGFIRNDVLDTGLKTASKAIVFAHK